MYCPSLLLAILAAPLVAPDTSPESAGPQAPTTPLSTSTVSDRDHAEVEEIVVTATRTSRKREQIPAGVSVVSPEQLENMRLMNVQEALRGIPGVQSETRNGGYDARLMIRGAGLKARYAIREIMVLLDGVPVTDPDGLSRLDFVDPEMIRWIDVVRGPNSTLYGANAAGGVINIITKDPFDEIKSIKMGIGSNNTQFYNVTLGTHIGETYFTVSGTRKSTLGWRQWNRFESDHWGIKIGRQLSDDDTVELNAYYAQADLRLPGSLTPEQMAEDSTQRTAATFRHNSRNSDIFSTYLKSRLSFGDLEILPLAYFQHWKHRHPVTGRINDGGATIYGAELQANLSHRLAGLSGTLTAGITGQLDDGSTRRYTYRDVETQSVPMPPPGYERILHTLSDKKGELADTSADTVQKIGAFLQESIRPTSNSVVDLGLRVDRVVFDLDSEVFQEFVWGLDRYDDTLRSVAVHRSFDAFSPRIGGVYTLYDLFNIYGTISTGFQTPQSAELEEYRRLEPARTINYEGGLKTSWRGGNVDLCAYHMEVSNEIVQTRLDDAQVSYSNAGKTQKRGVEISGRFRLLTGLQLSGAYSYSDFTYAVFDEPVRAFNDTARQMETLVFDRSGNQLPYVPRHQYSLSMDYTHRSGFKIGLNASSWHEYFVDSANSETYDGYSFVSNLMLGWSDEDWNLTLDAHNLFNDKHAVEVTKSTTGDLQMYPGAPRTVFGKIAFRL